MSCHVRPVSVHAIGAEGNEIRCDTQCPEIRILFKVLLFQLLCVSYFTLDIVPK